MARLVRPREPAGREAQIEDIIEDVRQARSFDFRNYKRATVTRRIERRMQDRRCKTVAEYKALLEREPAEYDALLGSLLVKVTSFFRDPELWERLSRADPPAPRREARRRGDPRLVRRLRHRGRGLHPRHALRRGDRTLLRHRRHQDLRHRSRSAGGRLRAPRRTTPTGRSRACRSELLSNWFDKEGGRYAVRKELRRAVVFGVNNLVSDAPISRLDLLVCRNVFIYMNATLQKRVLGRFHYALRRNGLLVLGKSELIPFAGKVFEPVDLRGASTARTASATRRTPRCGW